jgi:hypothetical protein
MIVKIFSTALFLLTATCILHGQENYYTRYYNLGDSANQKYNPTSSLTLCGLLLKGYVENKLPGYRVEYVNEVTYGKPNPADMPKQWNSKEDYFLDDMVTWNGRAYRMRREISPSEVTPDKSEEWDPVEIHGEPIKLHFSWPTPADSLTKREFLERMLRPRGELPRPFNKTQDYYEGEYVNYLGENFRAVADVPAGKDPSDKEYWAKQSLGVFFHALKDVEILGVTYHYKVLNGDTIHTPQMLSVNTMGESGFPEVKAFFYYCDAVRYLENIEQSAWPEGATNTTGADFLLLRKARSAMVKAIHQNLKNKKALRKNVTVFNRSDFDRFLRLHADSTRKYDIVRNISSEDFALIHEGTGVALIPRDLAGVNSSAPLNRANWLAGRDLVTKNILRGSRIEETVSAFYEVVDSDFKNLALTLTHCTDPRESRLEYIRFTEEYFMSPGVPKEQQLIDALSKLVVEALMVGDVIPEQMVSAGLYYDWSRIWTNPGRYYHLSGSPEDWRDLFTQWEYTYSLRDMIDYYPDDPVSSVRLSFVFEKTISNDNTRFEAKGIRVHTRVRGFDAIDFITWKNIETLISGSANESLKADLAELKEGKFQIGSWNVIGNFTVKVSSF